jgi:hypothetical protein
MYGLFISIILGIILTGITWIGYKVFPHERWQMIAAIPVKKREDGSWRSINLTWYGAIIATSYLISVAIFYFLASVRNIPIIPVIGIIALVITICMPASKIIALIVEKKKHTSSIGGATFLSLIAVPWIILISNYLTTKYYGKTIEPIAVLSALYIAYTIGEGFGRIACVSFGCCYGKPMDELPKLIQRFLKFKGLRFFGETKKVCYADNWEGRNLFPIQAITTIIYLTTGLIGFYFYLLGWIKTSMLLTLSVTQLWRIFSEFLRADYRGNYKILSAYQKMSIFNIFYISAITIFFPDVKNVTLQFQNGINLLWSPWFILSMELLWIITFLYYGISKVTGSNVNFFVNKERI